MARAQVGEADGKFWKQLIEGNTIRATDCVYRGGLHSGHGTAVSEYCPENIGKQWSYKTLHSVFYREISLLDFESMQAFAMDDDD